MKFNRDQRKMLSSVRGLQLLLTGETPDFGGVVCQLEYEAELARLQAALIQAQNWVVDKDQRVLVLVEGREFAGKGEAVRLFTEHLNPRNMRMVALHKPTSRERNQWYFKRYIQQLPEPGEIAFFDRSWYNRALVEPVHGFCTNAEYERFMKEVNHFERMLSEDGIVLIKFYFSISKQEQHRRIESIRKDTLKRWQLTKVDLEAEALYDTFTRYEERLLTETHSGNVPWHVMDANDLNAAVLQALTIIVNAIPFRS